LIRNPAEISQPVNRLEKVATQPGKFNFDLRRFRLGQQVENPHPATGNLSIFLHCEQNIGVAAVIRDEDRAILCRSLRAAWILIVFLAGQNSNLEGKPPTETHFQHGTIHACSKVSKAISE